MHRSPLRVAIDVSSAVDPRPTGIARTITGLVTGLQAHPGVELTLLCRSSRWRRARPTALFPGLPVRRWLDLGTPRGVDLLHGTGSFVDDHTVPPSSGATTRAPASSPRSGPASTAPDGAPTRSSPRAHRSGTI